MNTLPDIPDIDEDDFDIIALNGETGDCVTTTELDAIRQEHEPFLTKLEALAVQAIAIGGWTAVYDHINFHAPETEA